MNEVDWFGPMMDVFSPKYRMRRRWLFWWQVQEYDLARDWHTDPEDPAAWYRLQTYRTKAEAIAHLVALKLQGHNVEL